MSTFQLSRELTAAGFHFYKVDGQWQCIDTSTFELVVQFTHQELGRVVRAVAEALGL